MIYETLKECLNECNKTGKLVIKPMTEQEYTMKHAGFKPRLLKIDTSDLKEGNFLILNQ